MRVTLLDQREICDSGKAKKIIKFRINFLKWDRIHRIAFASFDYTSFRTLFSDYKFLPADVQPSLGVMALSLLQTPVQHTGLVSKGKSIAMDARRADIVAY